MSGQVKYLLSEDEIPTHWVNIVPDLPGEPRLIQTVRGVGFALREQ